MTYVRTVKKCEKFLFEIIRIRFSYSSARETLIYTFSAKSGDNGGSYLIWKLVVSEKRKNYNQDIIFSNCKIIQDISSYDFSDAIFGFLASRTAYIQIFSEFLWKCMILPPVEVSGVKIVKFSRVSNKKRLWEGYSCYNITVSRFSNSRGYI